ncbi:MAG: energy transducer TonB [Hyphomonadaceae bacterium]
MNLRLLGRRRFDRAQSWVIDRLRTAHRQGKKHPPMLIRATRTLSTFTLRALFYAALFTVVVVTHLGITGILRQQGWNSSVSLLVSGAVVLGLVLAATNFGEWLRARRAEERELERLTQGLPGGPCCVVWRAPEAPARGLLDEPADGAMPWEIAGHLHARYPKLARRLGVEGLAIAEFEVSADGRAKNIHCVDAWPSDVFYEAAREALAHARFQPKGDVHMRFGASYRMPFVFRIAGASALKDRGRKARALRPALRAAQQAVENLRSGAAPQR